MRLPCSPHTAHLVGQISSAIVFAAALPYARTRCEGRVFAVVSMGRMLERVCGGSAFGPCASIAPAMREARLSRLLEALEGGAVSRLRHRFERHGNASFSNGISTEAPIFEALALRIRAKAGDTGSRCSRAIPSATLECASFGSVVAEAPKRLSVHGRRGRKDPRKACGFTVWRAWRVLEVSRTVRKPICAAYGRRGREDPRVQAQVPVRECGGKD